MYIKTALPEDVLELLIFEVLPVIRPRQQKYVIKMADVRSITDLPVGPNLKSVAPIWMTYGSIRSKNDIILNIMCIAQVVPTTFKN